MLFYLNREDKSTLAEVRSTTLDALGWLEKDLEHLVARHIDRIVREDQLLVISQERKYQEEPDILAVDRNGALHIFELKRWKSSPENLLQVLRYGQLFGQYDYAALDHVFRSYMMRVGRKSGELVEAHQEFFELPEAIGRSEFNAQQRFIVMTDGLDRATREAIDYWSQHGLPVTALTYRVYETASKDLLLEVRPYGPDTDTFEDVPEGLRVVNTNATYMRDAWRDMRDGSKASAYYGRKTAVCNIEKGSQVALYHTGVGIIAFGKALDTFRRAPCGEDPDEEYYVPCEFEVFVDPIEEPEKAIKAREVNKFLGGSHRFRQTVYTLPLEAIDFVREKLIERTKDGGAPPTRRCS